MPAAPGNYNRLVVAPGVALKLGASGGRLLLNPPAQIAGQMTRTDMENRVWHLLREPGPDTGFPPPQTGSFPQDVVDRDLNIRLAQFLSATGLAPTLSDRLVTVPVFPVLDYPVPSNLASLTRVEYTPAGQQTYPLIFTPMTEWDAYFSSATLSAGQPQRYRELWAGYIRLFPQPGPGNAFGPGIGMVTFTGNPVAGQTIATVITNNPFPPIVIPIYTVKAGDTTSTIAQKVANLIAASNACIGPTPFLLPPGVSSNAYQLTAINPPGTQISFNTTIGGPVGLIVSPNGLAYLQPNGDTMNFYYSSLGDVMLLPDDTPGIPPLFHMAIVYGVLSDYWIRKQDPTQAKMYLERYIAAVNEAKALEWNVKRDGQPSLAGYSTVFDWDDWN